jgi:1,4-dihydroxy-2-naphthoyl-CoA hydrolase
MPFHTEITVAFNDVDAAGIVYFGNVFDYCHRAYERLLEAINLPLPRILQTEGWAMPLVHAEADYAKPMLHGERLQVSVDLVKRGRSSLHFQYKIHGPEGDLRATVTLVHATVDRQAFKPQPIDPGFLEALNGVGLSA